MPPICLSLPIAWRITMHRCHNSAEYRKFIEKDSALDRRFQSVKVEAPSVEDTVLILSDTPQI